MTRGRTKITPAVATAIVQKTFEPGLRVSSIRKLHGGMINNVSEWLTDGQPPALVAKINNYSFRDTFRDEFQVLRWCQKHTDLPVPQPLACFSSERNELSGLLMQRIPGRNLADCSLSTRGIQSLQQQFAQHIAKLHTHHRPTFGPVTQSTGPTRWIDAFAPSLENVFADVRDMLSSRSRWRIEEVLGKLDDWLADPIQPTLIHGDLWATNIIVDDSHPDKPELLAFIDCDAIYSDPEYELAYLKLFKTADETFFQVYTHYHPLRPGFETRCRVYWLNTMLLHVQRFGERYLPMCEDVVNQLARV